MVARPEFEEKLRATLNLACAENESDTPDYILATYLLTCLDAFNHAVVAREAWYGRTARRGDSEPGFVDPESEEAKPVKIKWGRGTVSRKPRDPAPGSSLPVSSMPVEQDTFDDRIDDHAFLPSTTVYRGDKEPPDVCMHQYQSPSAMRMCHRKRAEHRS